MNIGINMLGQEVNLDHPNTASGYYLFPDENIPQNTACPQGLRPGMMVIKGAGRIDTCNGKIYTENLPDIYLVDSRYKSIIRLILLAAIFFSALAVIKTNFL